MAKLNNTFDEINVGISGVNQFFTFDPSKVNINGGLTVDTNTLIVDASANKIGIGTSSLLEKLTVNGNIRSLGSIISTNLVAGNIATIGGVGITSTKIDEWDAIYSGPSVIYEPEHISFIHMYPNIYIDWRGDNSTYYLSDIIDSFIGAFPNSILRKGRFAIVNSTSSSTTDVLSFGMGVNFVSYIGITSDMTEYTDYTASTLLTPDDWCIPRSGTVFIQLIADDYDGYRVFVTGNILSSGGTSISGGI